MRKLFTLTYLILSLPFTLVAQTVPPTIPLTEDFSDLYNIRLANYALNLDLSQRNGEFTINYTYPADDAVGDFLTQSPRAILNYEDGVLNGPAIGLYPHPTDFKHPKVYVEGNYFNGQKTGLWRYSLLDGSREVGQYDPTISFCSEDLKETNMGPFGIIYDILGPDTTNGTERGALDVIPILGWVEKRQLGRTGVWKFFDAKGRLVEEREY